MFAIPLAAIGSLLALLFTSNSLMNANVLIGVIILIGIVVNNSIIPDRLHFAIAATG